LSAFVDCTNPGVVIIAVIPRVIIMITPEMNFVLFMRFFYLWTIKTKASFKALAFHLSTDKYPLAV
jgi:hypothetical protein